MPGFWRRRPRPRPDTVDPAVRAVTIAGQRVDPCPDVELVHRRVGALLPAQVLDDLRRAGRDDLLPEHGRRVRDLWSPP